jgi:glutamine amidotransferase
MRVTIFDYGAGNLHSLAKAIAAAAGEPRVEEDPRLALETDVLVLPGVGAFPPAAERLAPARIAMAEAIRAGLPCLGICLGMQLFFDASEEGPGLGLGVVPGRVTRINSDRLPQIGWNEMEQVSDPDLDRARLSYAYYANSFVCRPDDPSCTTAWSSYGADRFPAALRVARSLGVQFHPEKSSTPGVELIRSFLQRAGS